MKRPASEKHEIKKAKTANREEHRELADKLRAEIRLAVTQKTVDWYKDAYSPDVRYGRNAIRIRLKVFEDRETALTPEQASDYLRRFMQGNPPSPASYLAELTKG